MVNRDVIAAKLVDLSGRVAQVRKHCPEEMKQLAANHDTLDLVSFNLMLAVQSCADIASHIIADERWPAARSLAEGFERLVDHGILDRATAQALGKAVGLRNVIAHGYAALDVAMLHTAATRGVTDLDAFARQISAWVDEQTQPAT